MNATEQATLPLAVLAVQGAYLFRAYLERYNLHPLDVSLASGVRYLTTWNMQQGKPITSTQAGKVRAGLLKLTGVPFMAPVVLKANSEPENRLRRVRLTSMSHFDEKR